MTKNFVTCSLLALKRLTVVTLLWPFLNNLVTERCGRVISSHVGIKFFWICKTKKTCSSYLQHVEKQRPELGALHHEEGHLVAELGGRGGEAPVRHRRGVDGFHHLGQGLLGARRALRLLHEGGQLLLHATAVAPHAVEEVHQPVHVLRSAARRVLTSFLLKQGTKRQGLREVGDC